MAVVPAAKGSRGFSLRRHLSLDWRWAVSRPGLASDRSDKGTGRLGKRVRPSPVAAMTESDGGRWLWRGQVTSYLRTASVGLKELVGVS